ncbi:hypothetical protein TWF696_005041 [Orbilia brochopaga]|uniref:Uncharacterized protein n=1 Tax=Orbilia brochopaga TaxID=3140254 RepID=A0AAV9V1V3_9PEZI
MEHFNSVKPTSRYIGVFPPPNYGLFWKGRVGSFKSSERPVMCTDYEFTYACGHKSHPARPDNPDAANIYKGCTDISPTARVTKHCEKYRGSNIVCGAQDREVVSEIIPIVCEDPACQRGVLGADDDGCMLMQANEAQDPADRVQEWIRGLSGKEKAEMVKANVKLCQPPVWGRKGPHVKKQRNVRTKAEREMAEERWTGEKERERQVAAARKKKLACLDRTKILQWQATEQKKGEIWMAAKKKASLRDAALRKKADDEVAAKRKASNKAADRFITEWIEKEKAADSQVDGVATPTKKSKVGRSKKLNNEEAADESATTLKGSNKRADNDEDVGLMTPKTKAKYLREQTVKMLQKSLREDMKRIVALGPPTSPATKERRRKRAKMEEVKAAKLKRERQKCYDALDKRMRRINNLPPDYPLQW